MDSAIAAIIGLCIFLMLWYGGAHLYNRRHGQRLFRWLEAGLHVLGSEREAGWIGSAASGARINVVHAAPPFRRMEITLLVESREIFVVWLLNRLRRQQDRLIIKATLRSPRRGEVEIVPAQGQMARGLRKDQEAPWTWQAGPEGLPIAYRGTGAQSQVKGLEPWLKAYAAHLDRFSWRKTDPHVQLQMKVAGLSATPSERFLQDLQSAVGGGTHVDK